MKKYTVPATETTKTEPAWDFARSDYNNQAGSGLMKVKGRGEWEDDDYYVYEFITGDEEDDGVW